MRLWAGVAAVLGLEGVIAVSGGLGVGFELGTLVIDVVVVASGVWVAGFFGGWNWTAAQAKKHQKVEATADLCSICKAWIK